MTLGFVSTQILDLGVRVNLRFLGLLLWDVVERRSVTDEVPLVPLVLQPYQRGLEYNSLGHL